MQTVKKLTMLDQLGDGLTSTVSKCKISNEIYAIKIFKDSCSVKSRMREVQALLTLKDCNVVKMIAYEPEYNWIIFELLYQKDLFDFIAQEKKCFSEPISKYLFLNFAQVLKNMHSHGYVHRDVKLENILIHSETMDAKISDLGFAEPIHSHQFSTRSMGTNGYMAPELQCQTLDGRNLSDKIETITLPAADIFALGVCLFIMTYAHPPFQSTKRIDNCPYWKCIYAGKWDTFWKACERSKQPRSNQLKSLLQKMLDPNIKNRPTIQQILDSDWLKEGYATKEDYTMEMYKRKQKFMI